MTLTEQHLNQLDAFIQEMPTKYGIQLIKFFNEIQEQEKQKEIEEIKTEELSTPEIIKKIKKDLIKDIQQ